MKNYWTFSNLSFLSKLVESAAMLQLNHHCKVNDIVPHHSLAYKEYYSCKTALLKIENDALWCMERKEVLLLISHDSSIAFGTVDHAVLLKVLHNWFGVGVISLKWFESYLDNRYFNICIGTSYLNLKKLLYFIPQGSFWGAGVYNCYSSTVVEIILHGIDVNTLSMLML